LLPDAVFLLVLFRKSIEAPTTGWTRISVTCPPAEVSTFCGSLREPLNAPEADREFLLKGDVFQGPDRRLCRTEVGRSQPPGNPAEPGPVRHVLFELIFSVRRIKKARGKQLLRAHLFDRRLWAGSLFPQQAGAIRTTTNRLKDMFSYRIQRRERLASQRKRASKILLAIPILSTKE